MAAADAKDKSENRSAQTGRPCLSRSFTPARLSAVLTAVGVRPTCLLMAAREEPSA